MARIRAPIPLVVAVGGLLLLFFCVKGSQAIGHWALTAAYEERSLPILNQMLSGRTVHGVAHYLEFWDRSVRSVSYLGASGIIVFAILTSGGVRRRIDEWLPLETRDARTAEPAPPLPRLPVAIALFFLTMQGLAIATQLELWPFSPYRMYAELQENPVAFVYVAGVTSDGEFRMYPGRDVPPFDEARLPQAFETILATRDSGAVQRALASLEWMYERARRAHRHAGPPLIGVRLYSVQWTIDPLIRNLDHPDKRTILAERIARP